MALPSTTKLHRLLAGVVYNVLAAALVMAQIPALPAPLSVASTLEAGQTCPPLPEPGTYAKGLRIDPQPDFPQAEFRFSNSSAWRSFDRPLLLDAVPGEQRDYELQIRDSVNTPIRSYLYSIDRRPPKAPVILPESGDAGRRLSVTLSGEGTLFISVDGAPFRIYDPTAPPELAAPVDGSRLATVSAYAVDAVGNVSAVSTARWRLSEVPGDADHFFPPAVPLLQDHVTVAAISGLAVHIDSRMGMNPVVTIDCPQGVIPLLAVNAQADAFLESFSQVLPGSGKFEVEIPVPWGYENTLTLRYGAIKDDTVLLVVETLVMKARFPASSTVVLPDAPPAPQVTMLDGHVVVSWPLANAALHYSIDDGPFQPYTAPFNLMHRDSPYRLTYRAVNPAGQSALNSRPITVPPMRQAPVLSGVSDGATYGASPRISVAPADGIVLFEMTNDGSVPSEPGTSSPQLSGAVGFSGIPGAVVQYRLRVAVLDDQGLMGPERFISFVIDREPPPEPVILSDLPGYSPDSVVLRFMDPPADATIMVAVSEHRDADFVVYQEPIILEGSDTGRRRFVIQAYAEDRYGNRSAEIVPRTVLVDRTSLYVDARGRKGANGTPNDPINDLHEAISQASASGRRFLYLRGNFTGVKPLAFQGNITLVGGLSDTWTETSGQRTAIEFAGGPSAGSSALQVQHGSLALRSVSLTQANPGISILIDSSDADLSLHDVGLRISGGLEITAIRARNGTVTLDGTKMAISASVTGRALDLRDTHSFIKDLGIVADASLRLFDAIRIVGGTATLRDVHIDANPLQVFSGLSLIGVKAFAERIAIIATGGTSSNRLVHLNNATLRIDASMANVAWQGEAELFKLERNAELILVHGTMVAKARRLSFIDSRDSIWRIVNSIIHTDAPGAVLVQTNTVPQQGAVSANCFWGFSQYLSGAGLGQDIRSLNAYAQPAFPNFVEAPYVTFSGLIKGFPRLSAVSACAGSALPFPAHPDTGTAGTIRGNIGAEEFMEDLQ